MLRRFASDRPDLVALMLALPVAVLLLVPGCDPAVDVLDPSERYQYSLFGVLDVAADTQVIRVDPLGMSSQVGTSADFDAAVVLRNLSSGEEILLEDSLTTVDADSTQFHNFWTTHPIQPATQYQVVVRTENSAPTTATTTTPAQAPDLEVGQPIYMPCTFPSPIVQDRRAENTFVVLARNVPHIAAATIEYPILEPVGDDTLRTWPSSDHYDKVADEGNRFTISVFYREELVRFHPDPSGGSAECPESYFFRPAARLIVAAGGPQWPEWQSASQDDLARPDSFSNVEGGHGFVGGVYTDTIRIPFAERLP
jgi:hypothetical protein